MATFNAKFQGASEFKTTFSESGNMKAGFGASQNVIVGSYNALSDKPSIENHVLIGDSTIKQIGVGTMTVQEIEKILYLD